MILQLETLRDPTSERDRIAETAGEQPQADSGAAAQRQCQVQQQDEAPGARPVTAAQQCTQRSVAGEEFPWQR